LTTTLPPSLTFTNVNNGACANASGVVTCNFASLASGASSPAQITATPNDSGFASVSASVSSAGTDPSAANNTASDGMLILPFAQCSARAGGGPTFSPLGRVA